MRPAWKSPWVSNRVAFFGCNSFATVFQGLTVLGCDKRFGWDTVSVPGHPAPKVFVFVVSLPLANFRFLSWRSQGLCVCHPLFQRGLALTPVPQAGAHAWTQGWDGPKKARPSCRAYLLKVEHFLFLTQFFPLFHVPSGNSWVWKIKSYLLQIHRAPLPSMTAITFWNLHSSCHSLVCVLAGRSPNAALDGTAPGRTLARQGIDSNPFDSDPFETCCRCAFPSEKMVALGWSLWRGIVGGSNCR